MSKIKKYSSKDTISVYQFMMMCGLECSKRQNSTLSHKAMLRKLELRHKDYPIDIFMPTALSFDDVDLEKVKTGNILLVKDDYEQVIPYKRPRLISVKVYMSESEREQIRCNLINEYLEEHQYEDSKLKDGEIRYINRHNEEKNKVKKLGEMK